MIFPSTIAGIPCQIRVTDYAPGIPTCWDCPMEDADPPEDSIFEFEVLDRRGYAASWLAAKLTEGDRLRIEEEFTIMRKGEELANCEPSIDWA